MEIASSCPNVTLNNNGHLHPTTVYSWIKNEDTSESYEYFLALMNSKLIWWFIYVTGDTLQGDARRFKTNYINPIPVPKRAQENYVVRISDLALRTVSIKSYNPQADTIQLEAQIDLLVYKLYGLTYAEVLVVDPEFGMTEEEYNTYQHEQA